MKTSNILHVQMNFAIGLASPITERPAEVSPEGALRALDGAALAVASLLPAHLRTSPDNVTICEGARVHIGLDRVGIHAEIARLTAATDLLVAEIERLSDELADHKLLVAELLRDSRDGTCQQPDDDEDVDDDG